MARRRRKRPRGRGPSRQDRPPWWLIAVIVLLGVAFLARRLSPAML